MLPSTRYDLTTAVMPPRHTAPERAPQPGLVRIFPAPSTHPLPANGQVRLGRSRGADIVLTDPRASREHASIRWSSRGPVVRPAHARNGVFVGGARVEDEALLRDGGVLRCGAEIFIFRTDLPRVGPASRGPEAGVGPVWHALSIAEVERAARRGFDLLLLGETGTGKEVLARHFARVARPDGPFVALNLAAISAELFESELFGHARGAFTGAHDARRGAFRSAHTGVLFLDEVGVLAPRHHFKLHRVLEQRVVRPQGSDQDEPVDVLVVSATEHRLDALCRQGEFETSLYQRLRRAEVQLRPLRDRAEDLPALVAALLSSTTGTQIDLRQLQPELVELLALQPWHGNVRQLRHFLESNEDALGDLLCPDLPRVCAALHAERALGQPPRESARGRARSVGCACSAPADGTLADKLHADERRHIREALDAAHGNKTRAARLLGISRQHLHKRVRRLGVADDGPQGEAA